MGQSTNDIFPTAIHVAVALEIKHDLIPALQRLARHADPKGPGVGPDHQDRPHALDGCHAAAAGPGDRRLCPADCSCRSRRAEQAIEAVLELPVGRHGGRHRASTRIRSSAGGWRRCWRRRPGIPFVEAANHFEANAQRDGLVECHGHLRTIAVTLFNVANNIRWLGSGPALRVLRNHPAGSPARQLDHAGQGESGDVREPDAGRGPRDGQRPDHGPVRCRRRSVPAEHHDARDGARRPGEHPAAGRRHAGLRRVLCGGPGGQRRAPARRPSNRACRWSPA